MKIKRWLIISYILVILSPILTGTILFNWIRDYDKEIQLKDYLENMGKFEEYSEILDDPKFYIDYNEQYNFLNEEEKNYVEIKLYDKNGYNIYSTGINGMSFTLNKKTLFKDLYEIKRGYKTDSLKKPVFKDADLVGVYEIILTRGDLIRGINIRYILALSLFGAHFILVLFIVIKMINKKINDPLRRLIDSMKSFALGENIDINYDSKDEIGELINQFNLMKVEIEEKNHNIQIEKSSKEYMISAISHDLKTPLTSIRAYAEIIKNDRISSHTKNYEDIIISKCDYMKDMLEDLHLYTLLTSDYKMDFVNVEGEEFFQMLLSGYREVCIEKNLNYSEEIRVDGNYCVDVKSMMRVMDNLIANAIKYSEDKGNIFVGIYSSGYKLPENLDENMKTQIQNFRGTDTVVIVQNTGISIPKKELKNILDPFYKADNSRGSMKKSGTGLGLNIVKRIIERHKGRIKIISEENTTTVIYTVKRKEDGKDEKNDNIDGVH